MIVYITTASVVLELLTRTSVIFPVPLTVLPVTEPVITDEVHV